MNSAVVTQRGLTPLILAFTFLRGNCKGIKPFKGKDLAHSILERYLLETLWCSEKSQAIPLYDHYLLKLLNLPASHRKNIGKCNIEAASSVPC